MFRGLSAWRGLPAWRGASHAKSRMPGAAEGLAPPDGASQPSDGAPCSMVPQPPHLGSLILLRPLMHVSTGSVGEQRSLPGPARTRWPPAQMLLYQERLRGHAIRKVPLLLDRYPQ